MSSGILQYAQDMPTLEMVRLFHERFWIEQGYSN